MIILNVMSLRHDVILIRRTPSRGVLVGCGDYNPYHGAFVSDRLPLMDIFFLLLFGHALGDFGLQNEHMLKNKNRKNNKDSWYTFLTAHAVIHGGFVGFFTGSFLLALLEVVCHWVIDYKKMEGRLGMHTDQLLHIACKGLWIVMMIKGVA